MGSAEIECWINHLFRGFLDLLCDCDSFKNHPCFPYGLLLTLHCYVVLVLAVAVLVGPW
jgi:hypothetical protein